METLNLLNCLARQLRRVDFVVVGLEAASFNEWFFIPDSNVQVDSKIILKNKPALVVKLT